MRRLDRDVEVFRAAAFGILIPVIDGGEGVHEVVVIRRQEYAKLRNRDEKGIELDVRGITPRHDDAAGCVFQRIDECCFGQGCRGYVMVREFAPEGFSVGKGNGLADAWRGDKDDVQVWVQTIAKRNDPYLSLQRARDCGDSRPPPEEFRGVRVLREEFKGGDPRS